MTNGDGGVSQTTPFGLHALERFHELTALADRVDELFPLTVTMGKPWQFDRDGAQAWIKAVGDAGLLTVSAPLSALRNRLASGPPTEIMGSSREVAAAIRTDAFAVIQDWSDALQRTAFLYACYQAGRANAGLIRNTLHETFGGDYQKCQRWVKLGQRPRMDQVRPVRGRAFGRD